MAGSPERLETEIPEKVRQIMVQFDVGEKQAHLLLGCSAVIACETFTKWKCNFRKNQMRTAEGLLELLKKAKLGDSDALEKAIAELEDICKKRSWESHFGTFFHSGEIEHGKQK